MLLPLLIVFLGAFVVLALVLLGSGVGVSKETKKTLAVLASTLAVDKPEKSKDPVVDIRKEELFSAIPWVNRWLLKLDVAPRLSRLLYQANLKWTAGALILTSVTCCVIPAYLMYVRSTGVILALLIGALSGFTPFVYVLWKRKKRFDKFEAELPEALDMMVSALRVGQSLVSALDLVAKESPDPVGSEFRICCEEQNYGLELRTALHNLQSRVPLQDLNMVATAILIQKETGGNLAEVLDKVANVIRERFKLKRQIKVHTAQGRMTGWILSFLPVMLGLALYLVNPDTMSLLWKREIGIKLLYAAGFMMITGALIIRKIVRMDV
ncbi:type II secretion system F family protein [Alloacidobacterium sp.]|uniref:type II secretion system F family protein n=1 Tax=Alloacidobacterium sp. TaxID=2951999 RepID=UPI002D5A6E2D|nr:type II secretion system F family protein [Alloacidobacterium sp.]HYK38273.1 type II secretion system F family protein [Alloacidobacterium sp.]